MSHFFQHWHFYLPNVILTAVIYTGIVRLVLSFFAPPNVTNAIWRAVIKITEPAMTVVRFITPADVPATIVLMFCILWLMLLRVVFFLTMGAWGLLPPVGGAP